MGGVPVLLMAAMIGIASPRQPPRTYVDGSDVNGNLRGMTQAIESANPSSLVLVANHGDVVWTDQSPVPVPELADSPHSAPVTGASRSGASPKNTGSVTLNSPGNSGQAAMMKPDTNHGTPPAGTGFGLPPSTAFDQAGRPLTAKGTANGTTLPTNPPASSSLVAPPATRTSTSLPAAAPGFTGTAPATGFATSRAGGPSTEPATNRGTSWGQYAAPGVSPSGTGTGVSAALTPTYPFANQPTSTPAAPAINPQSYGAGPLPASDTFGRIPSGLTPPASQSRSTGSFAQVPTAASIFGKHTPASTATQVAPYVATPPSNTKPPNTRAPNTRATSTAATGTTGLGATANPFARAPTNTSGQPTTSSFGQPPASKFGQSTSAGFNSASSHLGTHSHAATGPTQSAATRSTANPIARPDPRLTATQTAAGAWSVDAFGYPIDRNGRRINTAASDAMPRTGTGSGQFQSSLGQPNPTSGFANTNPAARLPFSQTSTHQAPAQQPRVDYRTSAGAGSTSQTPRAATHLGATATSSGGRGIPQPATTGRLGQSNLHPSDPPSLASKAAATTTTGATTGSAIEPPRTASQPLFNGLLLISVVANLYLILWLKNLRVQYHDLVAAKRVASSSTSPS